MTAARALGASDGRIPVLYLAPWVDFGGSDKGTIDWFRWLDRDRFAPSLITTQPSPNRRLAEIVPYAEEIWSLPDLLTAENFARFVIDFIHTRSVRVLHVMNSRLGYDLLPDLAALEDRPRVVVQLHVEEPDRSGYVRYVTCRYGNLVDGFSASSDHLARAIVEYDVPRSRIHVIPTGVDAQGEFNPDRVEPRGESDGSGGVRILVAGRLVDQKDPLLMLDVVRRIADRAPEVHVDVVGDGPLEQRVRERRRELGLEGIVSIHPPTGELSRWMRSTDLMLMTSVFEGVPYVVYEALAMGVPTVAPALAGNVELMGQEGGILVEDRADAQAYADAALALIRDPERRRVLAESGRARMLESFSLRSMAAGHEQLYDELLGSDAQPSRAFGPTAPDRPTRLSFPNRPVRGTPPVSIVTPCFNHGRYLEDFANTLEAQHYPDLEWIIVDDASTDPGTQVALDAIASNGRARVLHQSRNRGPSAARNRAIAEASGRYILPVDADNLLLPGAVHSLVGQLQGAGEDIGFVYPAFRYFGTRDYQFDPPAYNLFSLLHQNYADTCSLLDREIFDSGIGYAEDIVLGHEDWDFVLELGARGVRGEPSRAPVMLYRKQGFTRSDLVEYLHEPFWREATRRHPELFGTEEPGAWGRFRGPTLAVKRQFNPAVTIILVDPLDFDTERGAALLDALDRQSCGDFEVIVECPRSPVTDLAVRRLPAGLCRTHGDRLQEALDVSRGRHLLVTESPDAMFVDRGVIEKLLRVTTVDPRFDATALVDLESDPASRLRSLDRVPPDAEPHSLLWRRELHTRLPTRVRMSDSPIATGLAELFGAHGATLIWRQCDGGPRDGGNADRGASVTLERTVETSNREATRSERRMRLKYAPAAVPSAPDGAIARWGHLPTWMPPETMCLVRHREVGGERRTITNDRRPQPGYVIEHDLGSIQHFAPPGTMRLVRRGDRYVTMPRGSDRDPDDDVLGYLEEVPLPLFTGVMRGHMPDGSEVLLLDSDRDPLRGVVADLELLGFIETFPSSPSLGPKPTVPPFASLVRCVDTASRTHRYRAVTSIDQLDASTPLSAELGQLLQWPAEDRVALWCDAQGHLSLSERTAPRPELMRALRWAAAPLAWRGFGYRSARPRAAARRLIDVGATLGARVGQTNGAPSAPVRLGHLLREPGPGRREIFVAEHPVLDDQFLTHTPVEATNLGYEHVSSLGYALAATPLTGRAGGRLGGPLPWTSRFGVI